ncbi:MAG TPA: hypothetical protein VN306_11795, partial [Mycobacterium sp.]|nr:hypothetical protein [Mycobacterium sp.]
MDRRRGLPAAHGSGGGGVGHPHDGALPMSSPDLQLGPQFQKGQIAPVRQRSYDRPAGLDNPRSPRRRA